MKIKKLNKLLQSQDNATGIKRAVVMGRTTLFIDTYGDPVFQLDDDNDIKTYEEERINANFLYFIKKYVDTPSFERTQTSKGVD